MGTAEPFSRNKIVKTRMETSENFNFRVQLTTSRIANQTRLMPNLLDVMTIHASIRTYFHGIRNSGTYDCRIKPRHMPFNIRGRRTLFYHNGAHASQYKYCSSEYRALSYLTVSIVFFRTTRLRFFERRMMKRRARLVLVALQHFKYILVETCIVTDTLQSLTVPCVVLS